MTICYTPIGLIRSPFAQEGSMLYLMQPMPFVYTVLIYRDIRCN